MKSLVCFRYLINFLVALLSLILEFDWTFQEHLQRRQYQVETYACIKLPTTDTYKIYCIASFQRSIFEQLNLKKLFLLTIGASLGEQLSILNLLSTPSLGENHPCFETKKVYYHSNYNHL